MKVDNMRRKGPLILIILSSIFIIIQFVPVNRSNPAVTADLNAPVEIKEIVKNSCYDCHSNETNWPWYSYIAPASWLVTHDVEEGRRHLNFSEWGNLNDKDKQKVLDEMWEEVEQGEMPLKIYTLLHSQAKLTDDQLKSLFTWTKTANDTLWQK